MKVYVLECEDFYDPEIGFLDVASDLESAFKVARSHADTYFKHLHISNGIMEFRNTDGQEGGAFVNYDAQREHYTVFIKPWEVKEGDN